MLQNILDLLKNVIQRVLSVLPTSPFKNIIANIPNNDNLAYLNWFFPVSECLAVMSLWLVAIGLFYGWSIVARWIKVIGD